jgi:23S rRNA pseudouridine1911/1915/1917 synthase
MIETQILRHIVPLTLANRRLDQIIAQLCPQYSRSQLQKWIKSGNVHVNGQILKAKIKCQLDDEIIIQPKVLQQTKDDPEPMDLEVVYEDDSLLVINKPRGLVVHPGAGNWSGTLVNGLLAHQPDLKNIPRAGIVHRLDKNTTGLMVVAKTLEAHKSLVDQLQARSVKREYLALVYGNVISGGTLESYMGRHPVDRKRMAVTERGKYAITHYRIEEKLAHHTLLRVHLETGRTHQIRVHLSWKNYPIIGDPTYGGRPRIPKALTETVKHTLQRFKRQALHATKLGFIHPMTQEAVSWQVPLPDDMQTLLEQIRLCQK